MIGNVRLERRGVGIMDTRQKLPCEFECCVAGWILIHYNETTSHMVCKPP